MEAEPHQDEQKAKRKRQRKSLNYSLSLLQSTQSVETIDLTMRNKRTNQDIRSPSSRKSETPTKRIRKEGDDEDEVDNEKDEEKDNEIEDLSMASRRSQPHRAARFTESYSAIAGQEEPPPEEDTQQNGEQSSEDSDSDIEIIPKSPPIPLSSEEQLEWEMKVQSLQQQLRNEEIKLVLLRKLKESQSKKEEKKEEMNYPIPPHVKFNHKGSNKGQLQITNISATQSPTKKLIPPSKSTVQVKPQDLTKNVKSGQPASTSSNLVSLHSETLNKSSISIVPVTSKASSSSPRPPLPIKNEVSISLVQPTKATPPPPPSAPTPVNAAIAAQSIKVEKEISSQHQAVAKMALRKQLEKTLLQIPTPRPKIQKLNFIPNGSSPEFVWLLGLDIVVDFITKTKALSYGPKEPFSCSQCKASFSETWNSAKDSHNKRCIICQSCYSSNAKKSLKHEHTSHLKAAFVKALQQEKEIERLSHSFSASPPMPTNLVSTVAPSPSFNQPIFSKAISSSRTNTASPNMFLGNNSHFLQQFSKLSPQQLQALLQVQAQSFMSANIPLPAHMVPFSPFIAQYPFHLMNNKAGSSQADLQRQYLLDMIPPNTSHGNSGKRKR